MVHQNVGRRGVQAPIRHECVEDGPADRAVLSCGAGSRPKFFEAAARFGWATRHAVGECHRIHGAGAGAADGLDANSLVLEELVENTPGESAVGAAALQGEFDRLFRLTFHPTSPDPGSAARPNPDETAPAVLSNVRGFAAADARRRRSLQLSPLACRCKPSVFPCGTGKYCEERDCALDRR